MTGLRYTLLGDGSSDRALMPILTWLLKQHLPHRPIEKEQWADLGRLPKPPKKLKDRIYQSLKLYPCDLLFIHRDAETESYAKRVEEIKAALTEARLPQKPPTVCVIPVRMTEAWLLIHEAALRQAAGNPEGKVDLQMPKLQDLERRADPKATLHQLLKQAGDLSGRSLKDFNPHESVHRLAEVMDDFAPLRQLLAFRKLEMELSQAITKLTDESSEKKTQSVPNLPR